MAENNIFVYLTGTAGSGKSTMTAAFQHWMGLQGLDTVTVNLDPGAEDLEYSPDVDIREWVTIRQVMEEYGLGPNGAQIAAADMLALRTDELVDLLGGFETNYFLVDTPGQLELFTFRKSSHLMVNALGGGNAVIVFAMDPLVASVPGGLISQVLLRTTVQFRFLVPVIGVLSKADLLDPETRDRVQGWATDAMAMNAALTEGEVGTSTQINLELLTALETVGAMDALVPVSSTEMSGFEDLYNTIQQVYSGGEDLTDD